MPQLLAALEKCAGRQIKSRYSSSSAGCGSMNNEAGCSLKPHWVTELCLMMLPITKTGSCLDIKKQEYKAGCQLCAWLTAGKCWVCHSLLSCLTQDIWGLSVMFLLCYYDTGIYVEVIIKSKSYRTTTLVDLGIIFQIHWPFHAAFMILLLCVTLFFFCFQKKPKSLKDSRQRYEKPKLPVVQRAVQKLSCAKEKKHHRITHQKSLSREICSSTCWMCQLRLWMCAILRMPTVEEISRRVLTQSDGSKKPDKTDFQ